LAHWVVALLPADPPLLVSDASLSCKLLIVFDIKHTDVEFPYAGGHAHSGQLRLEALSALHVTLAAFSGVS
jgi:hypothetical protein